MPFPFRAVIFDMDGLILDTEAIARLAWKKAGRDLGHHLTDEQFVGFIGRTSVDSDALLLGLFGPDFPMAALKQRVARHFAAHVETHGIARKPGVVELLDYLETIPVPKAVATSTRRPAALQHLGDLVPRFNVLATGDEVSHGKPAPDIFLLAAQRLHVPPADCLVLEDSLPGIRGASAAGMHVVMIPDLVPPTPDITHHLASLHEVLVWLKADAAGAA